MPLPYFPDIPDEDLPLPCPCGRDGCADPDCDGDDSWIADAIVGARENRAAADDYWAERDAAWADRRHY